jgi:hypothetical protein
VEPCFWGVMAFLGTMVGSSSSGGLPSSGGPRSGVKLGKGTGRLSFAEVVSLAATVFALGCWLPA